MHSFQVEYQGTAVPISNSLHPACRNVVYGGRTKVQLTRKPTSMLLHTPHFVAFGYHCCHQSLSWSQWLTSAGHANSTAILCAVNCFKTSKSTKHLCIVQIETSFYKSTCDGILNGEFQPPALASNITPNTNDIKVHYSFDYAEHYAQVHFPSDPLQPWPIYFLTPRKCTVFRVSYEALPRQVNVLTDEASKCGKGANNVVSQLHFFLETHGLGEKVVFPHADNCTSQNKNNCMVQYLVWRALTKRHTSLTLSFLVIGHTKFAPDWCFGLFKCHFCGTKVGRLKDITQAVNDSAKCILHSWCPNEDGSTIVPTYDWTDFFAPHLKR